MKGEIAAGAKWVALAGGRTGNIILGMKSVIKRLGYVFGSASILRSPSGIILH